MLDEELYASLFHHVLRIGSTSRIKFGVFNDFLAESGERLMIVRYQGLFFRVSVGQSLDDAESLGKIFLRLLQLAKFGVHKSQNEIDVLILLILHHQHHGFLL